MASWKSMGAFVHGFLLSLSLCMDLGLVNIVQLRISLTRGAAPAFFLGLGAMVGDLIYFSFTLFGATALLGIRSVRFGLWVFGTAVLAILAARAIREGFRPRFTDASGSLSGEDLSSWKLFTAGIGLALASPTAILWFAAVGGSVIASYGAPGEDSRQILGAFAAGFAAAGAAWAGGFAYGAAALRKVLGTALVRVLSLATAILFLYFAAGVFRSGWREFHTLFN